MDIKFLFLSFPAKKNLSAIGAYIIIFCKFANYCMRGKIPALCNGNVLITKIKKAKQCQN